MVRRADSVVSVKVAVLQFASGEDVARNRADLQERLMPLIQQRPDLVVLPEASQRAFGVGAPELAPDAESLEGPFVNTLIDLAGESVVIAGMFERTEEGEAPHNTTVAVDRDGIRAVYRKIHLYDALGFSESAGVTPGNVDDDNLVVVDVGGVGVGILTCFDLRFPEMSAALVAKGAHVLAIGAAWVPGPRKSQQFTSLLSARAIETVSYVVAAAQPTPRYCGRSQIIGPDGAPLRQLPGSGSASMVVSLPISGLAGQREAMPIEAARRLGDLR